MPAIKQVLKGIMGEIKPDSKTAREADLEVDLFVKRINANIKKRGIKAKAVVGGSFAKDTWLKGDHDVDIFVLFDLQYKDKNISAILRQLIPFRKSKIHGSRDYYQVNGKVDYEIVPVLWIKKAADAWNVTDFSPWHVRWVNTNGRKYKEDIRLFKRFCKAQKIYGAESYIRGFSGHVADILVIYYKGFLPLMRAAAKWKPKQVIDLYNRYKGRALLVLNKSKIEGPLIIIDPVQPGRNAAAALNEECFKKFISIAKLFLNKPSKKFFEEEKTDFESLKKKGKLVRVEIAALSGKTDVIGTKLLKAFTFLNEKLGEFKPASSGWWWDKRKKALFWYVLKERVLPATMEWEGPPLKAKKFVSQFRKKYRRTFVRKGRVCAIIRRKYRTPTVAIRHFVRDAYFGGKVKKADVC